MLELENKYKGIWFYGLSGSGKTHASRFLSELLTNSFVIDGDIVRKYISFDLGYSQNEREIQVKRVFGMARLVMCNNYFPIISTVTMSDEVFIACSQHNICVVEIERSTVQRLAVRDLYLDGVNVVGKDIPFVRVNSEKIVNDGTSKFLEDLSNFVK